MIRSLAFAAASILALGPCSKKDDASDAGAMASASASATMAAPTAEAPKPAPPADAAKSCTVTPGKLSAMGDNQELEITMKNTGTRPWHYCNVYGFAYDKSGALLGRGGLSVNLSVAPGAEMGGGHITLKDEKDKPLSAAVLQTAVFELVATTVYFDDKSEWSDRSISLYDHKKATGPTAPAAGGKPATTAPAKPAGKK